MKIGTSISLFHCDGTLHTTPMPAIARVTGGPGGDEVRVGEMETAEVEHRFMTRGIVPSERSRPGNLSLRPLDDLDQHLLAFFDAEMAEVPIELVASGVEIADRSCSLEVDLDALPHFLEGDGDVVDLL